MFNLFKKGNHQQEIPRRDKIAKTRDLRNFCVNDKL